MRVGKKLDHLLEDAESKLWKRGQVGRVLEIGCRITIPGAFDKPRLVSCLPIYFSVQWSHNGLSKSTDNNFILRIKIHPKNLLVPLMKNNISTG